MMSKSVEAAVSRSLCGVLSSIDAKLKAITASGSGGASGSVRIAPSSQGMLNSVLESPVCPAPRLHSKNVTRQGVPGRGGQVHSRYSLLCCIFSKNRLVEPTAWV